MTKMKNLNLKYLYLKKLTRCRGFVIRDIFLTKNLVRKNLQSMFIKYKKLKSRITNPRHRYRIYKTEFFITSLKYQQKKMFRKNYTDTEIEERLNIFWIELEKQCNELNNSQFEFYWEMWGVWWMPWFIEVDKKSLKFSANNISSNDLKILVEKDKIEIVKIYERSEMQDEFDRIRYRIIKKPDGADLQSLTFF